RPVFDSFYKQMEKRLDVELTLEKRRTYFLGADGVTSKNVTHRTLLVGDAAGFVDPMMGEGIAYAMKSGVFAAEIIRDAIHTSHHEESFLQRYEKRCRKEFSSNFALAEWAGMKSDVLSDFILQRASNYELASEIMAKIARGEMGYAAIPYEIFRKLPSSLPGMIKKAIQSRIINSSSKGS
ncbi:MAG: NAD(P)/FAD-dependent oxidoreductase, partial [Candidatus Hodarchaeota archaeon]